jgi:hypothetical protein
LSDAVVSLHDKSMSTFVASMAKFSMDFFDAIENIWDWNNASRLRAAGAIGEPVKNIINEGVLFQSFVALVILPLLVRACNNVFKSVCC